MISLWGGISGVLGFQVKFLGPVVLPLLKFGTFTRIVPPNKLYRVAMLFPFLKPLTCWFNHAIIGVTEIGEFHPAKFFHYDPPFILRQGQFIFIHQFPDCQNVQEHTLVALHSRHIFACICNVFLLIFSYCARFTWLN